MEVLISSSLTFLLVMDALGNVPLFLTSLRKTKPERRQWVILRECLIALVVMVMFLFLGKTFLALLHIDEPALTAAGGVILMLIAIRMVFPTPERNLEEPVTHDEPFIVPRDLASILETLKTRDCDIATLKRPVQSQEDFLNPNVVKVVVRDDNQALYFSRAPIPYDRSGANAFSNAYRHIGVYGYKREALERLTKEDVHVMERREGLEQLRALAIGMTIQTVAAMSRGRGIDTEEDLEWARGEVTRLGEECFP